MLPFDYKLKHFGISSPIDVFRLHCMDSDHCMVRKKSLVRVLLWPFLIQDSPTLRSQAPYHAKILQLLLLFNLTLACRVLFLKINNNYVSYRYWYCSAEIQKRRDPVFDLDGSIPYDWFLFVEADCVPFHKTQSPPKEPCR